MVNWWRACCTWLFEVRNRQHVTFRQSIKTEQAMAEANLAEDVARPQIHLGHPCRFVHLAKALYSAKPEKLNYMCLTLSSRKTMRMDHVPTIPAEATTQTRQPLRQGNHSDKAITRPRRLRITSTDRSPYKFARKRQPLGQRDHNDDDQFV